MTSQRWGLAALAVTGGLAASVTSVVLAGRLRRVPFLTRQDRFSIGIYEGPDPFHLQPHPLVANPVLTFHSVTDTVAEFVADPFLYHDEDADEDTWYLFFEVLSAVSGRGELAVARSADLRSWEYLGLVLQERFHLSYPYVFAWQGERYMIPESGECREVRLYRATDFPLHWTHEQTLLRGEYYDSSVFRFDDRWWMLTASSDATLRLFHADILAGPWQEHPSSPVVPNDASRARPGGRVAVVDGRPVRFAQDIAEYYGKGVSAFRLDDLTVRSYVESPVPSRPPLGPSGMAWNRRGMHHVDAHQLPDGRWIAAVDGIQRHVVVGRGGRGLALSQVVRAGFGLRARRQRGAASV